MGVPTIEEYIVETARIAGDIHVALINGLGSSSAPGSALFELAQLSDLATYQLPRFGVLDHTPAYFAVTVDPDPSFVQVAGGEIAYNKQILAIAPQRVAVARAFSAVYNDSGTYENYVYGVVVGLPMQEAIRASSIYNTVVSASANSGDDVLYIDNISIISALGFPLQAYVGTTFVQFSGTNTDDTGLIVDPAFNGGVLPTGFVLGTTVNFIYSPRVLAICGLPVSSTYQPSGLNPSAFDYYPPTPTDWLPIAKLLMVNPGAPAVATQSDSTPAILSTIVSYPAPNYSYPVFSAASQAAIYKATTSATLQFQQARSAMDVGDIIRALEDYTTAISNDPQVSFSQYWAQQPFYPSSYFARGIGFGGFERIEFPDSFAQAYYDITRSDLQHTFAIFRGDLYSSGTPITGTAPSPVTVNSYMAGVLPSLLTRGTYTYGVSAVSNSGESVPTYMLVADDSNTPAYFFNEILFPPVAGALYYHVYRLATTAGDQTELRLTASNGIAGGAAWTQIGSSPSVSKNLFQSSIVSEAIKFTVPAPVSGPVTTQYLGAIGLQLKTSALIANNANNITIDIYTDSSGPSTLVGSGTNIPFTALTTSFQLLYSKLDVQLTQNDSYWLVIGYTAFPPGGTTIALNAFGTGSGKYATKTGSTWTVAGTDGYCLLRGYIDNGRSGVALTSRGVHLTGRIALTPRSLSVYVPPLADVSGYLTPTLGTNVDATTGAETTVTKNDMVVTVVARLGATGTPQTLSVTVPQFTARGTRFSLGSTGAMFDRVDSVTVVPGTNLQIGSEGTILWSFYDFVTVETVP